MNNNILSFSFILPFINNSIYTFTSKKNSKKIKGLLFHSISQTPNISLNLSNYSLEKFKKICKYLRNNCFYTSTLKEIGSLENSNNNNYILLTFDDGLSSVYQLAFPALLEYNIKATVFCTSGFIGKKSKWDVFTQNNHLNKEEIVVLSKNGIEIGSHTKTHPYLPYLSEEKILAELSDSKKELEDIIGKEISSLSFPFGGFNKKIWEIAKSVGYKNATIYRGKGNIKDGIYKVYGVYSFDSVADVVERIKDAPTSLLYIFTSEIMSHFSKGTPLWRFRKNYRL